MVVFAQQVLGSVALIGFAATSLGLTAGVAFAQQAQTAPSSPIVVQGDKPQPAVPQPAATPSAIDQTDPLICEKIQEIGSRLKVKKV